MKNMKKRIILAVTALVLLIGIVVYLTYAWYTKMTGIAATEFTAARWEFSANYQVDSFVVNVYEYQSIYGHNIAAPGTAGTLDLLLNCTESDTDVNYIVQLDKTTMSEDFQKRIYFYYDAGDGVRREIVTGETMLQGTVEAKSSAIVSMYWNWIYDYDEYLSITDTKEMAAAAYILKPLFEAPAGTFLTVQQWLNILKNYQDNYSFTLQSAWNALPPEIDLQLIGILRNMEATVQQNLIAGAGSWEGITAAVSGKVSQDQLIVLQKAQTEYGAQFSAKLTDCLNKLTDTYFMRFYDLLPTLNALSKGERDLLFKNDLKAVKIAFSIADSSLTDAMKVTYNNTVYANTQALIRALGNNAWAGSDISVESFLWTYIHDQLGYETYEKYYAAYMQQYEAFDSFDTRVGANPGIYKSQMGATVYVTGEQVEPSAVVH